MGILTLRADSVNKNCSRLIGILSPSNHEVKAYLRMRCKTPIIVGGSTQEFSAKKELRSSFQRGKYQPRDKPFINWTIPGHAAQFAWSGSTGIPVDPRNTSKMCSVDGHIDSANRATQSIFKCVRCGFADLADHNAAVNISARAAVMQPMVSATTGQEQATPL
jgi:hypothetical protein